MLLLLRPRIGPGLAVSRGSLHHLPHRPPHRHHQPRQHFNRDRSTAAAFPRISSGSTFRNTTKSALATAAAPPAAPAASASFVSSSSSSFSNQSRITHLRALAPSIGRAQQQHRRGPVPRAQASSSSSSSSTSFMALSEDERRSRLQAACRAVRLACRLCQAVQKKLVAGESASKSDKSPVTVADYGAQVLVAWALEKEQPAGTPFSMVAEEDTSDFATEAGKSMLARITQLVNETLATAGEAEQLSEQQVVGIIDKGASQGGSVGQHWVLDPIDGTKGFLRGDQYAVALGLLDEGEVVLGVLGCPNLPLHSIAQVEQAEPQATGCLFSALKGHGATVEPVDGSSPPTPVHVSSVVDPSQATFCESYESAHSQQGLTAAIARNLGVTAPPYRIDSQAKYGAMARGDAVIYLRFPHAGYREKIWDHAAGSIVITEAGGVVSDASGKPLDFSKGRFLDLDTGIVATNKVLHPKLLAAVQAALQEEKARATA